MFELSIRFMVDQDAPGAPIQVALSQPDTGTSTAPAPFESPLGDPQLGDLRWYLETFAGWPTGPDYERARRIETRLEEWGKALFASVFSGQEATRFWQSFLNQAERDKILTVDATDPRVLRLPWELLADAGGFLFAQRIGIRRRLRQGVTSAPNRAFDPPVRVLVVVARPEGSGFIPPRAVSGPLLDALDGLGERVVTEFLYPPTLAALSARLYDESAPPVHVVHFDGHGVYDERRGLGYLLFEDDQHRIDQVDAARLGTLLNQCGVPLMVLNACQSARQDVGDDGDEGEANPFASVAARLIRSGVGSVLAMNYSVLVVAARKFVSAFYGALADGVTVGRAVDQGRRALLADPARHTLPRRSESGQVVEETIRLRDWFLPALYQQTEDPVVVPQDAAAAPATIRSLPRALTDPSAPGGLPPEPLHGFHGRAHEMLELERKLADHAIVVLHGFGGMGKTALAAEAGRWFYRTGRFPGGAAFISFEGGGGLQQLGSWVAQAVSGDPDYLLGCTEPVQRVTELLREKPALVILDNFESVLGHNPLIPPEELQAVLNAVWNWARAGQQPGASRTGAWGSRVLITTRSTRFNDARFDPGAHCAHVALGGLARPDALELAGSILDDLGIDRDRVDREGLVALMDHLGGHPLSLYLVLPHLRMTPPAALIERFEDLLPGFTSGAATDRHESLEVSLDFSLRRLGDETRAVLPSLSIFQGGCVEQDMLQITEIDPDVWQAVRADLEEAALVRVEALPGVRPPFLHFHPTLLPFLARDLPPDRRPRLERRYWQQYVTLAIYLDRSDVQFPFQARAIAIRELPNLRHAFDLALAEVEAGRADPTLAVGFSEAISKFLDHFGRWRERDALLARLDGLDLSSGKGFTKAQYLRLSRQGEIALQRGRADQGAAICHDILARMDAGMAYGGDEALYDRALTLMLLGRCLETMGRPNEAIRQHEQARAIFLELSTRDEGAKQMLGRVYTDLGDCLRATGHFDRARQAYEDGLAISRELDDRRSVGVKLGQLGTLALVQGDLEEARRRHSEALHMFGRMGEPQMEAVAWHQLGMIAQQEKNWVEAERCYRNAVRIREEIRDRAELAKSYNQLGLVARGAGRIGDAEQWYLRTIEYGEYLPDKGARVHRNLAILYMDQNKLDKAREHAMQALAIEETLDLPDEVGKTYSTLANIAERQGRPEEVEHWRRKEHASRDQFAGTAHHLANLLHQFQPVIAAVVAAAKGHQQARTEVENAFDAMKHGSWQIEGPIRRIWAGERDPDALTASLDYQDRAVILAILHGLDVPVSPVIVRIIDALRSGPAGGPSGGPAPGPGPASQPPPGGGQEQRFTLDQLLDMVVQAVQPTAPPGMRDMLLKLTQQMSTDPNAPEGIHALGQALHAILNGERNPDLSALSPDLASMVRNMLARLSRGNS